MARIQGLLFLLLTVAPFASAQFPLSVGVKAGVPLTNPLGTAQGAFSFVPGAPTETLVPETSKTYLVGPTIELRLPLRISVEADGLFHPIAIPFVEQTSFLLGFVSAPRVVNATTWEFPILAKYHFSLPFVKPYAELGPSFRALSHQVDYFSSTGITVGGGADVKVPIVRISPEFRYIHWAADTRNTSTIGFPSKQDQVEFLVGFSF